MGFFSRKDPGRPSIRDLTKKAKGSTDTAEAAVLYAQAGALAQEAGKARKALSLYRSAIEKTPGYRPASEGLCQILTERGETVARFDEQSRYLEAAIDARGDSRTLAAAHAQLASTAEEIKKDDVAREHYERAFELDPSLVAVAGAARRLARRSERWDEAVEIFEREIAVIVAGDKRSDRLLEYALMMRDHLGDFDKTVSLLDRAIRSNKSNLPARKELVTTLVARAERASDDLSRDTDQSRAGDVICDFLPMLPQAERLASIERALQIAPAHLGALKRIEEFLPQDSTSLLQHWARHIAASPEGGLAHELRSRLALAHERAGRLEEARAWYAELGRRGDVDKAIYAMELQLTQGQRYMAKDAADALLKERPDERLTILLRLLRTFKLEAPTEAYSYARAALREDPTEREASGLCIEILEEGERWGELEVLLSFLVSPEEVTIDDRRVLLMKMASIREEHLEDINGARAAWRELTRLADPEGLGDARRQWARLAELAEAWDELVGLLEKIFEDARDSEESLNTLRKLVDVQRDARVELDGATNALLRVLALDVDEEPVLEELSSILLEAGDGHPAISTAWSFAAEASPEQGSSIFRTLGRVLEKLDADQEAYEAWSLFRAVHPDDAEALERLIDLALEMTSFEVAFELLNEQAQSHQGAKLAAIYNRQADVAREHLKDPTRAADALSLAHDASPDDRAIAEKLSLALGATGRFAQQAVALRALIDTAPDTESKRDSRIELARLLSDKLDERSKALLVWERALAETVDLGILETLAEEAREADDQDRFELILERLSASDPDAERRAAYALARAQVISERLGSPPIAITVLKRSAESDGRGDLALLGYLEGLAISVGDESSLAFALELQSEAAPKPTQWVFLRRVADLYEGPLNDPEKAVAALERWEERRPEDTEPRFRLLNRFASREDWEDLLVRLDSLIAIARDDTHKWVNASAEVVDHQARQPATSAPERKLAIAALFLELAKRSKIDSQRVLLFKRAADGFEFAGRPGAAFGAITRALRIAGPTVPNLARAEQLAKAAGTVPKLSELYDKFMELAPSQEAREIMVLRQGRMLIEDGELASEALDRLLIVSADNPLSIELCEAMEAAAEKSDRVRELVATYKTRADLVGNGERAVSLVLKSARLCAKNRQFKDAVRFLAHAVEVSEADDLLIDQIEEEARGLGRRVFKRMVGVFGEASRAAEGDEDEIAAKFLVRSARLMTSDLNAAGSAFDVLKKALSLAPTADWVLDELETVAAASGSIEELDGHLEDLATQTMSKEVATVLLTRRASIIETHLGGASEAADVYYRVRTLSPNDPQVHRRLRFLLIEAGRVNEVIGANEKELGRTEDPAKKIALMRDNAVMWETQIKNTWEAIDAWKRVLGERPDDREAAQAIARLDAKKSIPPSNLDEEP